MMKVKSKVWLEKKEGLVFGDGKAFILRSIAETGSINKAVKKMKMSYRHAWSCIRSAEERLGKPLLLKTKGGLCGGGALLTDYAQSLLSKFEALEEEVKKFTDRRFREIFNDRNI